MKWREVVRSWHVVKQGGQKSKSSVVEVEHSRGTNFLGMHLTADLENMTHGLSDGCG